jgi:hypothetical protein
MEKYESIAKNLFAGLIHDYQESVKVLGCPAVNDFKKSQEKINERFHLQNDLILTYYHDAVRYTAECREAAVVAKEAAEKAKTASEKAADAVSKVWLSILIPSVAAVLGFYLTQIFVMNPKQDRIINELQQKLQQDEKNQNQTIEMMEKLYTKLKIVNGSK